MTQNSFDDKEKRRDSSNNVLLHKDVLKLIFITFQYIALVKLHDFNVSHFNARKLTELRNSNVKETLTRANERATKAVVDFKCGAIREKRAL